MGKRKITKAVLLTCFILASLLILSVFVMAEEPRYFDVSVNVTYDQTSARAMLDYINKFRSGNDVDGQPASYKNKDGSDHICEGLSPLTYDYGLEKAAMQRAAELVMQFSRSRPNMKSFKSVVSDIGLENVVIADENMEEGTKTAYATFKSWRDDNLGYSYQSHRRRMLSDSFKYIAIGHVTYKGWNFWVQVFSENPSGAQSTAPKDGVEDRTVEVREDQIDSFAVQSIPESISIKTGGTADIPSISATISMKLGVEIFSSLTTNRDVAITPEWTSNNEQIVMISEGKLKGGNKGTATLSATLYEQNLSIPVSVKTKATGISFRNTTVQLKEKETAALTPIWAPEGASEEKLTWKSSNENAATVDSTGKVTAKAAGTAEITAQSEETSTIKAVVAVTVTHDMQKVTAVTANCEHAGNIEHWSCKICKKHYADQQGKNELKESEYQIAQKPHTKGAATKENVKPATCVKAGSYDEVIRCTKCGTIISKTAKTIPAKGHKWGAWKTIIEPTAESAGMEKRVCENDSAHTEKREIPKKDGKSGNVTPTSKKVANKITNVTPKKTIKKKTIKKKSKKFQIKAKVKGKAKLTFKRIGITKTAKKFIKVSKSGKVTVKPGLKKGKYKLIVRITSAETKTYKSATVKKKIVIRIK